MSSLTHFFRRPALSQAQVTQLVNETNAHTGMISNVLSIETEYCFNVQLSKALTPDEKQKLIFLLSETFEPHHFAEESFLGLAQDDACPAAKKQKTQASHSILEVGPRLNFTTAWSSNAVQICRSSTLPTVQRVERSRRYRIEVQGATPMTEAELAVFATLVHDKMTECVYHETLSSFDSGVKAVPVFTIPLLEKGRVALEKVNADMGLGFDSQDLDYYSDLFINKLKRDPTSVEAFDIGQSNSEHSRHWFFTGTHVLDGKKMEKTLFKLVKAPWVKAKNNSVIGFCDNSSAIKGYPIETLIPKTPGASSVMEATKRDYNITFTAETHNFPTGVCPFAGAETGPGGRIRDGHATGTGSLVVAGTAAYCVGNLHIPGYPLVWEDPKFQYPPNLATPLKILIDASNGASDYGNKFGEPLIQGYARSFGQRLPDGERREWIKPIMFSGGVGQMDARHSVKGTPEKGMLIIKLGGPAYRIGMGGGAASSMVQGDNAVELDFAAVQRGDAEMEQKTNRVIRTCVELGADNPIISIHDQGAGGNGNVLKEIAEPAGALINIRDLVIGDKSLSVLELWGAEYQENDALLILPKSLPLFTSICQREKSPFAVVGTVTGDGKIVVYDSVTNTTPVNIELDAVLGKLPAKTFVDNSEPQVRKALDISLSVTEALDRVLRLLSVGSKRFLTSKVDRCVTGLIAQQQCVGPLQTPLADVAVMAQSHFGTTGAAISVGEQPLKGLLNPEAMARCTTAEMLTNLVWAKVSALEDVKASGNWMWAAKLKGEGCVMYKAAAALSVSLLELGIAIDGGKDSLSMAVRSVHETTQKPETVKAPGALVMSAYCTCPDITLTVTPDLKRHGGSKLVHIRLSEQQRLGGSALAQVCSQLGDVADCPDVESMATLKASFNAIQELLSDKLILAGHDVSDGGLLVAVLEMAFAGNCGIAIKGQSDLSYWFAEEPSYILEIADEHCAEVLSRLSQVKPSLYVSELGHTAEGFAIQVDGTEGTLISGDVRALRDVWEATSFELQKRQTGEQYAVEEKVGLSKRTGPSYHFTFRPTPTPELPLSSQPRVAIVRQEGSNGDREMASAFHAAGFQAWDVHMSDLVQGKMGLAQFRGVCFVGGFSYADVLDSAKGWAGVIKFNTKLAKEFEAFYAREDTFSLGVCNGCQLMTLLGWVPYKNQDYSIQPRFIHNKSGRFECRWTTVEVQKSPALMLRGMEGSRLGVWTAHGEGQCFFPKDTLRKQVLHENLAPLRYIDDDNKHTTGYPFNPNGSPDGIASLCSADGRHLAMMPHPERCFLEWQWPYLPEAQRTKFEKPDSLKVAPWIKMFQNAREWCNKVDE